MITLVNSLAGPSSYRDQTYQGTSKDFAKDLADSTTLYIGNLSFATTEEQIYELFFKCGEIKRIIMGLDRYEKTPCGFCFVEYFHRSAALNCLKYINGTKLDERIIRCDIDSGFKPGRQFGRGKSGGQVRDEYRPDYDPDRGGYGHQKSYDAPIGGQEYRSERSEPVSNKRGREDDSVDDGQERSKKHNPRFREDDDEEED